MQFEPMHSHMAFDNLINYPAEDLALLHLVIDNVQTHFGTYQNVNFYLTLRKCENSKAKITAVKIYNSLDQLEKFYFDTPHMRACILIRFVRTKYHFLFVGPHLTVSGEATSFNRKTYGLNRRNYEPHETAMPPYELLKAGFAELEDEIQSARFKKTG